MSFPPALPDPVALAPQSPKPRNPKSAKSCEQSQLSWLRILPSWSSFGFFVVADSELPSPCFLVAGLVFWLLIWTFRFADSDCVAN